MRTKFYSAWATLGLVAATLVRTSHAEIPRPAPSNTQLVIDTTLDPMRFQLKLNGQPDPSTELVERIVLDRGDSIGLNFALASPGILFGSPPRFLELAVHFGSSATTRVVFRDLHP